ncbi:MAG: DUF3014 domain-containing protein [Pseudomonadota bacterium]|nr:DUF3014 domain-containing protein [Pseudomonadota bacterium]
MKRQSSVGSWAAAAVVLVAVVAAGVYMARKAVHESAPASAAAPAAASTAAVAPAPAIRHPIAKASGPAPASTAPLPSLENSDASVLDTLTALAGGSGLRSLLVSAQIIPDAVATIDALPRRVVAPRILPLHPPGGGFLTASVDGKTVMSDANAARYAPYMRVVASVDPAALVGWYVRYYPLFQQAYVQLGYPRGYFNDRLIAVIDNLLAAPDLARPAALAQSKPPFYAYADPALESLSAGQKMLLRAGPANEAVLKAKLRAIRARLVGAVLPAAPASSRTAQ